jgi:hypothetical protein
MPTNVLISEGPGHFPYCRVFLIDGRKLTKPRNYLTATGNALAMIVCPFSQFLPELTVVICCVVCDWC